MTLSILVGTWQDGLFSFHDGERRHELAGRSVRSLVRDGAGGALAIVDQHTLMQRAPDGEWSEVVRSDLELAAPLVVGSRIYLGTDDDARLLCLENGSLSPVESFDSVTGRETWFAGSVIIDGQRVGPPLGVRSLSTTADGKTLLVNVHVGGIPRSTDGGRTWEPTIAVESDVHEVRGHPTRPEIVVAAAAVGLGISRDGGATWSIEQDGLHASYCSAVEFLGDDLLVSTSEDHFADRGAIYRRPVDGDGPLTPLDDGPRWLDGISDTHCLSTWNDALAVVARGGQLHVHTASGYSRWADDLPPPSCVLIPGAGA